MLIPCPECKKWVSYDAYSCPRCGVPDPGELFEQEQRRPYEESAQRLLRASRVWVRYAAHPCGCWKPSEDFLGRRVYSVIGRIVQADVKASQGEFGKGTWYEYDEESISYAGGERYYVEFAVECESCGRIYLGSWTPRANRFGAVEYVNCRDRFIPPASGAPYLVYGIQIWTYPIYRWLA